MWARGLAVGNITPRKNSLLGLASPRFIAEVIMVCVTSKTPPHAACTKQATPRHGEPYSEKVHVGMGVKD